MKLEITTIMRFDKHKNISHIIDFTGKKYYIDDKGKLYRGNIELVSIINNDGYIVNRLKDINGKYHYVLRHQLVAQTFLIDSFKEGKTVDHIDRNRSNNCVENLRWATPQEQVNNTIRVLQNSLYNNKKEKTNINTNLYVQTINDQEEYFIKNEYPKFNRKNYPYLSLLYDLYFSKNNDNVIKNNILKEYANLIPNITDRKEFYNYCIPIIKNYKQDLAISMIKYNISKIDIKTFEELFLDKKYNKKQFKDNCIKLFLIEEKIFKSKETINEFLKSLGYCLKNSKSGSIVRKIR